MARVRKSTREKSTRGTGKKEKILLYAIVLIITVLAVLSVYLWYQSTFFGESYKEALQSESSTDVCATPSGYTDEQWREHMSHHPDRYKDCLNQ